MLPYKEIIRDFVNWYSYPGPQLGDAEKIVNLHFSQCVCCSEPFHDQRYAQSPTKEPLSENMVRLVRSQLSSMFYENIVSSLMGTQEFRFYWHDYMLRRFDQPCLPPEFFDSPTPLVQKHLLEYADVDVAVYLDSSSGAYDPGFSARMLGRYTFRKWFHWHDGRPPFLSHQWLARPVGIKGGSSRDVQSIRKFHSSLCDAVSTGLKLRLSTGSSPARASLAY